MSIMIKASEAPAYLSRRIGVREGKVAELLEIDGPRARHQGMRHWYRRDELDTWAERTKQTLEAVR